MTYIERINNFWTLHEEHSFNTNEIALFFYLLKINNLVSWKESFERNNQKIMADLNISFNTLKSTRNKLKQAGILDFETRNGVSKTRYTLSNFDEVTNEVGNEVCNEVGNEVTNELNKIKIKTKKKTINPQTPFADKNSILDDWKNCVDQNFVAPLEKWFDYKNSRGNGYQNISGINTCYNHLRDLSDNDPIIAMKIVNQSIANNWAGLFELKTSKNGNNRTNYQTAAERGREQLAGVASKILAKY